MKEEDKELLLKDLCGRLPYGVKVLYEGQVKEVQYIEPLYNEVKLLDFTNYTVDISEIKPYLRPLSSMTKEEMRELRGMCDLSYPCTDYDRFGHIGIEILKEEYDKYLSCNSSIDVNVIDWLNKHHFDYRIDYRTEDDKTMIERGFALVAPDGMYN